MKNRIYLLLGVAVLLFSSCSKDKFFNKTGSNVQNFEQLWKIVDGSYCYFELKNLDWDSIHTVYSAQVSEDLTKYQFFDVCENMMRELEDGHVNLISDFDVMTYGDFFLDHNQNYNEAIVARNYLGKDFIYANWFKAKKIRNIGYIRYDSFTKRVSTDNLKEVFTQLGEVDGIIIDVRDNTGGYIAMVDTIISNFFPADQVFGYIKYKTGPGHNEFTDFIPKTVQAKSTPIYDGNIVVLTNRLVYSAANQFVSAMSVLDNVTLIGDQTGGGGGAPWTSEMYNGWQVVNSRNPLFDANKQHIEFGVAPDIKVEMDPSEEMEGVDSIIEYAIDYLLEKQG